MKHAIGKGTKIYTGANSNLRVHIEEKKLGLKIKMN